MNICETIQTAMKGVVACEMKQGEAVVTTQCLYPSFENVVVFVRKTRDGYRVHDSAKAYSNAWSHGRDARLISNEISKAAMDFHLKTEKMELYIEVPTIEWLYSGIIAVANGSSQASSRAVAKTSKGQENDLHDKIGQMLTKAAFKPFLVNKEVEVLGSSGKQYLFDFSITRKGFEPILVDIVTPHHSSITHKYVAFADVVKAGQVRSNNIAVFNQKPAQDDVALITQVADLIPSESFETGTLRALRA